MFFSPWLSRKGKGNLPPVLCDHEKFTEIFRLEIRTFGIIKETINQTNFYL